MSHKIRNMKMVVSLLVLSLVTGCQSTNVTNQNTEQTQSYTEEKQEISEGTSYESKLFDQSYVHTIDIEIAEADWEDLLANPLDKTKYEVNVTIDGEKLENVSFATKGNTSLSSVASDSESDRYSFKLNFGKFVDGQTYYGLDKLNLNNVYADATYMKDYIAYEIFRAAGAESPLTSYVAISINGESFGLYLAVEEIGESYLDRTHAGEGDLYKPETEQLDNVGNMQMPEGMERPEKPTEGGEAVEPSDRPEGMERPVMPANGEGMQSPPEGGPENMDSQHKGGMFDGDDKGASLKYTDDQVESYSDIFNNAETDVTQEDQIRLINSLKSLSEGENLESCLDTESVIRYFVAHNFVLNGDSYTGNMLHNYYLYENNGQLSMLPWDYNLAFGSFMGQMGGKTASDEKAHDATSIINTAIDTPLSSATNEDRPMWSWIAENDNYMTQYHTYFNDLITDYFTSGAFETEIDRVYNMILPYVQKDTSAFYSVDEFTKGYETLKSFCLLRAESIQKQLNGEIASVSTNQDPTTFVSAEDLNISSMGTQSHGNRKDQTP